MRLKRSFSTGLVLIGLAAVPVIALSANMQERVCERVVRRFSNDEKMWQRVNNRIVNSFGFLCVRNRDSRAGTSSIGRQQSSASVRNARTPHKSSMLSDSNRNAIQNAYYSEFAYETCDLNPYQNSGFSSKEECQKAIQCLAQTFARLIPTTDLQSLAQEMQANGGEGASIAYFRDHKDIESSFMSQRQKCL